MTQTIGAQSGQVDKTVEHGIKALQSSKAHINEVTSILMASNELVEGVNRGLEEIAGAINQQRDVSHEIARNVESIASIASMANKSNQVVKHTVDEVKQMEVISESYRNGGAI